METGHVEEGTTNYFIEHLHTSRDALFYSANTGSLLGKIFLVELIRKEKTTRKKVKKEDRRETKSNISIDELNQSARRMGISYGQLVAMQYLEGE